MSGHCPKCGTFHEEDDARLCSTCSGIRVPWRVGASIIGKYSEIVDADGRLIAKCASNAIAQRISDVMNHEHQNKVVVA